jgi:hypothetical protein
VSREQADIQRYLRSGSEFLTFIGALRARWRLTTLKIDRRGRTKTRSEHLLFLDNENNQTLNVPNNLEHIKTEQRQHLLGHIIKYISDPHVQHIK